MDNERSKDSINQCFYCSGRDNYDSPKAFFLNSEQQRNVKATNNTDHNILEEEEEEENQFVSSHESCGSWTRLAATLSANVPQHHHFQQWEKNEEYSQKLLELARNPINQSNANNIRICSVCVDRVANAMEEDIKRLEHECQSYEEAFHKFQAKSSTKNEEDDTVSNDNFAVWKETFEATKAEHDRLMELLYQEWTRAKQLTDMESALLHQLTDLKLHTSAFMDQQSDLAHQTNRLYIQLKTLQQVPYILPQLFKITLHDHNNNDHHNSIYRGAVFINGVRLTHKAMSSSGWGEVNSAWAQASMLLLFVSAMVDFHQRTTSEDDYNLRIVPLLTSCAKIIQLTSSGKKMIYHLGWEDENNTTPNDTISTMKKDSRGRDIMSNTTSDGTSSLWKKMRGVDTIVPSLKIFHVLLFQIVHHVESKLTSSSSISMKIPMTMTTMGDLNVNQIHERDDNSWLRVIHGMASNMEWLVQHAESLLPSTI